MTAPSLVPFIGFPAAGNNSNTTDGGAVVEVATATSGYVPLIPVGTIIQTNDRYWGGLELIRLSIPTGTSVNVGNISVLTANFSYTAVPNTANLGRSLAISTARVPSNATFVQYAWFAIAGQQPVLCGASVAADTAFGITAAGVGGANSAGKQILNARVVTASTTTVVKANTVTQSGSNVIYVQNTDGWFVGLPVSGTGIAASSVITAIDADNRRVVLNNNATATGSVSVTGTYNDGSANYWNIATFNRPFAQGAIT